MKKLIPFAFIASILFMSCSGLLHRNNSNQIASVKVSIAQENYDIIFANQARTVTPENGLFSYNRVSNWKISFTSEDYSKTYNPYDFGNCIELPYGDYKVSAEGLYTYDSIIYTYVGEIEELTVDSSELNVNINVGLKKTDGGTGAFIYFITFGDKFNITAAEQITAKMTNLKDDSIFYVKNDSIENPINDFTEIGFENKQYSIVKTEIPSGFYKLELYYQEKEGGSKAQIVLPDPYFVIADGLTTKVSDATTNIYKLNREYWATTDSTVTTNGITKNYPVYINTLLENLKTDTEWDEVTIYINSSDDISELEITKIENKNLYVYHGDELIFYKKHYVPETPYKIVTLDNYLTIPTSNIESGTTFIIDDSLFDEKKVAENKWDTPLRDFFNSISNNEKNLTIDLSNYEGTIYKSTHFFNCAKVIILPDNLSKLYLQAFENSKQLEQLIISDSNPTYKTVDGVLYSKDMKTILRYPPSKAGETFTLPETVNKVGLYATFANTKELLTISNFDQITEFDQYCASIFDNSSITEITLNNKLTSLPYGMFKSSALRSITIPASVTKIANQVFSSCNNLTSIEFEDKLTWYMTTSYEYKDGTKIDVTDPATNVTIFAKTEDNYSKYFYKQSE